MLLRREQRNIFHSSYFAFLHFGTVLHVWFINTVVCKNQADNLLQVFNIVRPQVAQKVCIQRWFQCHECQYLGVSALCTSPDSTSLWWEYLCWAQMRRMALSSVGMWRTTKHYQKSQWQSTLGFPFLFLMPQQFCAERKELSHPSHQPRAGSREIA